MKTLHGLRIVKQKDPSRADYCVWTCGNCSTRKRSDDTSTLPENWIYVAVDVSADMTNWEGRPLCGDCAPPVKMMVVRGKKCMIKEEA